MIYLDNASTTIPDNEVLSVYQDVQREAFYNGESLHIGGQHTNQLLESCKQYIKKYFETDKEVIFTRSGSHANEVAIRSYLEYQERGTILVSPYEHPSIHAALEMYKSKFEILDLPLDGNGEIDVEKTTKLVTDEVVLIITQHVNSETGYILPINDLSNIAMENHIPIHVDGVQAVHKLEDINVQLFTSYAFSSHKFHGTKGSGSLLINHEYVKPLNDYYFHEMNTQNGTIDSPSIVAMTKALSIDDDINHMKKMKQYLLNQAVELRFTPIVYNEEAPHILALLSPKFEGQYIMQYLSNRNICISTGTACGHGALLSDGLQVKIDTIAGKTYDQYIRFSISKYTTKADIDNCFEHLKTILRGD
ncbi:aminotransferase class V-fold PLP-dependent enzyme [Mammaliicoccus lentus]|uniref:cysteine desulfurase family protein n=1 Tax=Mammaliicoccus lentus TaxID=42858 RepID=UPI00214C1933|nr:aminotransferase class V-fold PLP-dependent enzyme [Mammaliicoccus lentus]MCR1872789.1 aminotransferase class V-fold PLP-dependent enzyme [Mammaliicoccus lentus]